jgi:hypothetical protein
MNVSTAGSIDGGCGVGSTRCGTLFRRDPDQLNPNLVAIVSHGLRPIALCSIYSSIKGLL